MKTVPSPIDCQLRNQKIFLPSRGGSAVKRPRRDAICQTELTLPPLLPKEIEDLLRPYFSYTIDQQQSPSKFNCDTSIAIDHDARDASLRRKLFGSSINSTESSCDDDLQCSLSALSPPPESPKLVSSSSFQLSSSIIYLIYAGSYKFAHSKLRLAAVP